MPELGAKRRRASSGAPVTRFDAGSPRRRIVVVADWRGRSRSTSGLRSIVTAQNISAHGGGGSRQKNIPRRAVVVVSSARRNTRRRARSSRRRRRIRAVSV